MSGVKLIDIKKSILSDNKDLANTLRKKLKEKKTFMVNIMASPGSGKTSLIIKSIETLRSRWKFGVLEGDIETSLDSEKLAVLGVDTVQIRTGGSCHLEAPMVEKALEQIDVNTLDLIFIENVGNLVCPAECDTGAFLNVVILSVPEGDDKPFKYPLIFTVSDFTIINKIDYPDFEAFDIEAVRDRVKVLNPNSQLITLSCRTGEGIKEWTNYLDGKISSFVID